MTIIDEPVRGQVPPAWFGSLSGVERLEAVADHRVLAPPLMHLVGLKPAHITPGSGTWTMPLSPWHGGPAGGLEISMLGSAAMYGVGLSTCSPGMDLRLFHICFDHFRPTRAGTGNLVARARVVNANRFFIYATVEVEDAEGRQILHGRSFAEPFSITPPPTTPPDELPTVEPPVYATPDPYRRPLSQGIPSRDDWKNESPAEVLRSHRGGSPAPHAALTGWTVGDVTDDGPDQQLTLEGRGSEWFCLFRREVDPGVIASILNGAGWFYGFVLGAGRGRPFVGLYQQIEILGELQADGRPFRVETGFQVQPGGRSSMSLVQLYDADDRLIARHTGLGRNIDDTLRRQPKTPEAKRVLYTLLFTDIVDSTKHLERLGDAKWRQTLAEQQRLIRAEIARHHGREVDTQGDSFFIRFTSPAEAIACARTARDVVKRLGIEIRAGLHTGECEEQGGNLAGMAVHLAARIQGKAGAGEILVSSTLKDLALGSGLAFTDRGEHELKGIDGVWRLYALEA